MAAAGRAGAASLSKYARHTSSCMCCICIRSPQSLTYVSSWGFTLLSPSCNSNYLEHSSLC
ncbi:hypothetical protein SSJG_01757 [Escherichia coli D9]|nr:hypothetical protein SSJG_01757 [Escherichia coli D9]